MIPLCHSAQQLPFNFEAQPGLHLKWECLGPNACPTELSVGGRAIPSYARGRGNGSGRINQLWTHRWRNRFVLACSPTGGLFVTHSAGKRWSPAGTDALPKSGIASVDVHPNRPRSWVVATGDSDDRFAYSDGIWRTTNAGKTWQNINGGSNGFPVSPINHKWTQVGKVLLGPNNADMLLVASNKGLYQASGLWSSQVSWKKLLTGTFYDLEADPNQSGRVVASGSACWLSEDGGHSWQDLGDPYTRRSERFAFVRMNAEFSADAPGVLWVVVTCSEKASQSAQGNGQLYRVDLESRKWTHIRDLKQTAGNVIPTRARAFDINPKDSSRLVVGNVQPVYLSANGGRAFEKIEKGQMHDDVHHLAYSPNGKLLWAAHDGGVSLSADGGRTFSPRDKGIGAANIFGLSVAQQDQTQVLYGGYDTGGNLLINDQWFHVTWGDGFQTVIDPNDAFKMYATKQNGAINASTNAAHFDNPASCSKTSSEWHTWIRQDVGGNYLMVSGDQLARSADGGSTWEVILNPRDYGDDFAGAYRFFTSDAHPEVLVVYVIRDKKSRPVLMQTFNLLEADPSKVEWKVIDAPRDSWLGGVAIHPKDPNKLWMAYTGYAADEKVWYYSGGIWVDISGALGWSVVESMVVDAESGRLYIGSTGGVWTRSISESDWIRLAGLPGCAIKSMAINRVAGTLVVGTFGRGVWQTDLLP